MNVLRFLVVLWRLANEDGFASLQGMVWAMYMCGTYHRGYIALVAASMVKGVCLVVSMHTFRLNVRNNHEYYME